MSKVPLSVNLTRLATGEVFICYLMSVLGHRLSLFKLASTQIIISLLEKEKYIHKSPCIQLGMHVYMCVQHSSTRGASDNE